MSAATYSVMLKCERCSSVLQLERSWWQFIINQIRGFVQADCDNHHRIPTPSGSIGDDE